MRLLKFVSRFIIAKNCTRPIAVMQVLFSHSGKISLTQGFIEYDCGCVRQIKSAYVVVFWINEVATNVLSQQGFMGVWRSLRSQ